MSALLLKLTARSSFNLMIDERLLVAKASLKRHTLAATGKGAGINYNKSRASDSSFFARHWSPGGGSR